MQDAPNTGDKGLSNNIRANGERSQQSTAEMTLETGADFGRHL